MDNCYNYYATQMLTPFLCAFMVEEKEEGGGGQNSSEYFSGGGAEFLWVLDRGGGGGGTAINSDHYYEVLMSIALWQEGGMLRNISPPRVVKES